MSVRPGEPLAQRVRALARTQPEAPAYLCDGESTSWRAYERSAEAFAGLLCNRLELEPGERVAVLLPDGPDVHVAFSATERAGLVAVGIGPRAGPREIEHLLRVTGARSFVSRPQHQGASTRGLVADLRSRGVAIDHHVEIGAELGSAVEVDGEPVAIDSAGVPEPARQLGVDDLFLINSTSGTTGMPKCVMHDQARWLAFHSFAVPRGRLSGDDVFMSVVPAPFGFGIWTAHFTPTLLGVPSVVMSRFDADEALGLIERHRVSVLAAVSTQFIMLLEHMDARAADLSSLRVLFTGGEAVPYARAAAFEDRTGAAVLQFYGSNETGAVSATSLDDPRERRLRTAGRVIPEMHVRLFDEAGREVTEGGEGIPGCRGPTLSGGYYGEAEAIAAVNAALLRPDGWMLLGDRVRIDADGYLEVIGRSDDFIIRGGKNISGPAVEEQVATHPAIALAAAVAMPDPIFGERVCVYVELRDGASPPSLAELIDHLARTGASKESFPERLIVLDALPRGSGGKVAKQALRDDVSTRVAAESAEH